jgi:uncharacterized protein
MVTRSVDIAYPAPTIDPINRDFWEATRDGKLLLGSCKDTGRLFFYPRGVSPFTLSTNVELVEAAGGGTIYSLTVMRTKAPYVLAFIELDEGPRLLTNVVDCNVDTLKIGDRVKLAFRPGGDDKWPIPVFVLDDAKAS